MSPSPSHDIQKFQALPGLLDENKLRLNIFNFLQQQKLRLLHIKEIQLKILTQIATRLEVLHTPTPEPS